MEKVEFTKIRRTNLHKFIDAFDGVDKELDSLFVNYDTSIPVDFNNLKQQINQNAGRNFRKNEIKLFSMEYRLEPQKVI